MVTYLLYVPQCSAYVSEPVTTALHYAQLNLTIQLLSVLDVLDNNRSSLKVMAGLDKQST